MRAGPAERYFTAVADLGSDRPSREQGPSTGGGRSWWKALLIGEVLILLFSLGATGRGRYDVDLDDEGNRIARLLLDEPTFVESMVFYIVTFHVLIVVIFLAAWVVTKRRRRAYEGDTRSPAHKERNDP